MRSDIAKSGEPSVSGKLMLLSNWRWRQLKAAHGTCEFNGAGRQVRNGAKTLRIREN